MNHDLDGDGKINEREIEIAERRTRSQRKMAIFALGSMFLFTALLFLPIIPDSRINALSDLLGLFYIAQASVVGAFMGVSGWMSRK